jgi:hypothetical protein
MPNWVFNKLTINGESEKIDAIVEMFGTHHERTENRAFSGAIICRKKDSKSFKDSGYYNEKEDTFYMWEDSDNITKGLPDDYEFAYEEAFYHFPDFNKVIPQPENIFRGNLGEEDKKMCEEQGIPNWYDWNYDNWGTKWNCSECSRDGNVFIFQTAWSTVPKIISVMSNLFPDVQFVCEYADEMVGSNCGMYIFKNGDVVEEYIPDEEVSEEFANNIWGFDNEEYVDD